uniref:Uncharacterized protein n=1 Tax=Panagrolaimus sp. ES5 TaxID=591445 RepID=A0AC34GNG1_9BILA
MHQTLALIQIRPNTRPSFAPPLRPISRESLDDEDSYDQAWDIRSPTFVPCPLPPQNIIPENIPLASMGRPEPPPRALKKDNMGEIPE